MNECMIDHMAVGKILALFAWWALYVVYNRGIKNGEID